MSLVKLRFRRFVIGVYHLRLSVQLIERRHPDGYLAHSQLVAQDEIFLCRFRLAAQRLDLKLKLIDLIVYAKKIFLGFFKLALGFLLTAAIARYAGRFLKDLTAIGAFC